MGSWGRGPCRLHCGFKPGLSPDRPGSGWEALLGKHGVGHTYKVEEEPVVPRPRFWAPKGGSKESQVLES